MSEEIIKTKRGIYGRVNITLPLSKKNAMLTWAKASGMKKAEFLRLALTTGFLVLSKGIPVEVVGDVDGVIAAAPASDERGRTAIAVTPHTDRGVEIRE